MVTLEVTNLNHFFTVVDKCDGPIEMDSPDGQKADLRNNAFLQYVLGSTQQPMLTTHVQLKVRDPEDVRRLLEFAISDGR